MQFLVATSLLLQFVQPFPAREDPGLPDSWALTHPRRGNRLSPRSACEALGLRRAGTGVGPQGLLLGGQKRRTGSWRSGAPPSGSGQHGWILSDGYWSSHGKQGQQCLRRGSLWGRCDPLSWPLGAQDTGGCLGTVSGIQECRPGRDLRWSEKCCFFSGPLGSQAPRLSEAESKPTQSWMAGWVQVVK